MCLMVVNFMNAQEICTVIHADYQTKTIAIENKTDDPLHRAFGINEQPTWEDWEAFLRSRCFPETRDKLKLVLKDIGVPFYDPLLIISKTKGRMAEDFQWLDIIEE